MRMDASCQRKSQDSENILNKQLNIPLLKVQTSEFEAVQSTAEIYAYL
jgi:hypothetical protein